jgi:Transcriptional regulators
VALANFPIPDVTVVRVALERLSTRLASDLTIAIRESMRLPILAGLDALPDWTTARRILRAQHHAVVDAIAGHDAAEAVALMEQHIRSAYERMTSLHPDSSH